MKIHELLICEARRWINVREEAENKGQIVEMFQMAVGKGALHQPWCLSFVQFCVNAVDMQARVFMGAVRNQLPVTAGCAELLRRSPPQLLSKDPEPGFLIVWRRYDKGQPTPFGHVGIISDVPGKDKVLSIEGNTGNGDEVKREGDGVYLRTRSLIGSANMKVVAFIDPWGGVNVS